MADQQQHAPGGHYSARNPVPTVKKFIENLDKDKAERDRRIDEQNKANKQKQNTTGDAIPHKPQKKGIEGTQQTVTDPTTGKQVVIEDVSKATMDQVENPQVRSHMTRYMYDLWLTIVVVCAECESGQGDGKKTEHSIWSLT